MIVQKDNLIPEDVAGALEALVAGEGPFEDADLARLKDIEVANAFPVAADSPDSDLEARIEALEQRTAPRVERGPILLPDQNIEHGKVVGAFTSGTTLTVDPVDVNGNDTGEADLVIYVQADRTSATVSIADGAEVTWERFDTIEDDGTAGVLVGTLIGDGGDKLVAHKAGQTANYLATVLQITPTNNLLYTDGGATYNLSHDIPWCCAYCLPFLDNIEIDSNGHVGRIWCGGVCCGPGWRCTP